MALILRIDVDRPYGKKGPIRHIASRVSSDYYLPVIDRLGYLDELKIILRNLTERQKQAYVFYRKCTLPSAAVLELMRQGGHRAGLHLENSRTFETFQSELHYFQKRVDLKIEAFSKHGSGKYRYGWNHYAPYEPDKYLQWGKQLGLRVFFGNHENPQLEPVRDGYLHYFPSAFWLEPHWRNTKLYDLAWLLSQARTRDVVLLFHPDNVISDPRLMKDLLTALEHLDVKLP